MAFLFIIAVHSLPTTLQERAAPTIANHGLVISEAPVKPRAIVLTIVAFLLGALAAGSIGVRVIREVRTDEGATSLPEQSTTTTEPAVGEPVTYQVDPNETVMSSTALVPVGLAVVDSEFAIEYEISTLAPHAGVEPLTWFQGLGGQVTIEPGDFDHIWPRTWVVETHTDEFTGGTSNPDARTARIEVDEGFSPSEVRAITVTEALAPYSVSIPFTLSLAEPTSEVYPGVIMELVGVSDQGRSSIVQVQITRDDPEITGFFVNGGGPGWRSAVFQAEGAPIVNLTWVGGELPADIPLLALGGVWLPVDGSFDVSLEGIL